MYCLLAFRQKFKDPVNVQPEGLWTNYSNIGTARQSNYYPMSRLARAADRNK